MPNTLKEVIEHHLKGGGFTYRSYDHKLAESEYRQTDWFKDHEAEYIRACNTARYVPLKVSKHDIPVAIRDKYAVWKKGKLRRVEFGNDGRINRVYIGAKYALPIYERDLEAILKLI